tara:strand:- start:4739 stop:4858 length:120 start_codon:yes stop_codon:yes gene_type:complete
MYDPKGEIVRGVNVAVPAGPEPWAGIPATADPRFSVKNV